MAGTDANTSQPVRTENNGDVVAKLVDFTTNTQGLAIDVSGRPTVNQGAPNGGGANAWYMKPTDGTNSQAYLSTGEAKVSVTQPLPAGTNLIGSVDIKDSAGASITLGQKLMAASLPVTIASDQSDIGVKLHDGADTALTSTLVNSKQALDVQSSSSGVSGSAVPFGTAQVGGSDGTLLHALKTDTNGQLLVDIKDSSGNSFSNANPLPVNIVNAVAGTEINDWFISASNVAAGGTENHDYSITAAKTFKGKLVWASASGRIRIDVQISPDGTTFTTKWTGYSSASQPWIQIPLDMLTFSETGTGSKIRVIHTNLDKLPFQISSTISGTEV